MVDFNVFFRSMKKRGLKVIPNEVTGLSLALLLRENPNKPYMKGDTVFMYDSFIDSYIYCNPFNKKLKWWYRANGLNMSYNHYYWDLCTLMRIKNKGYL